MNFIYFLSDISSHGRKESTPFNIPFVGIFCGFAEARPIGYWLWKCCSYLRGAIISLGRTLVLDNMPNSSQG